MLILRNVFILDMVLVSINIDSFNSRFWLWQKYHEFWWKQQLSTYTDNRKKHTLILGKVWTQRLEDTTVKEEAKYSINITRSRMKFCHKNSALRWMQHLFICYQCEIYQFEANGSEVKPYPLCLGNI